MKTMYHCESSLQFELFKINCDLPKVDEKDESGAWLQQESNPPHDRHARTAHDHHAHPPHDCNAQFKLSEIQKI